VPVPAASHHRVVIVPPHVAQLRTRLLDQYAATQRPGDAPPPFGHRVRDGDNVRATAARNRVHAARVAAIAQPMQLHAEGFQIENGGCVLGMAAQQADGGKIKTLAGRRQRVCYLLQCCRLSANTIP